MIDWVSAVIPCHHRQVIDGGRVVSILPDGEVQWAVRRSLQVRGSFDSAMQVRTHLDASEPCSMIEISGNPVKWLQGHNLWGTDDLVPLVCGLMSELVALPVLGLIPRPADITAWERGGFTLTRVDVTASFGLDTRARVLEWLRAGESSSHLAHRGRGQLVKGSTLYFGKNSRRWALKLYSKGQEVDAHPQHQPALLALPRARAWADGVLRSELVIRSMELHRLKLRQASAWLPHDGVPFDAQELLRERLGSMTMTTVRKLPLDVLESLRPALRMAAESWAAGVDLRATLPRRTFYKYRSELLPHGADIAIKQNHELSVIPLVRVLEAKPVGVPEWAIGTPLFWEPRRRAA